MIILALFNTAGYIFGPIIVIAGVVALTLCLRATLRMDSPHARRTALFGSLSPFAAGICGAIFGFIYCLLLGQQAVQWLALGKVCLAGLVVSTIPLLWCLALFRRPRMIA